ncbi:MAG: enoyl-CoA hydratase/isomerase family protein [Aestuariibacter sp.]
MSEGAQMNSGNQSVIFSTNELSDGRAIGHAMLNLPKSLNALNLEMVEQLLAQLGKWQRDDNIVAVVLSGEGEKAFCAGGDVVSLHNAMKRNPKQIPDEAKAFFTQEYTLDYLIHTFGKPFIVVGTGIVMGGGMGLFAGASHRVVTETTRMAMPEVTIGLFPDVGGSYFLNRMPDNLGLFLGLTGVQFNGADALHIGLADFGIASASAEMILNTLTSQSWSADIAKNNQLVSDSLDKLQQAFGDLPESKLQSHQAVISDVMAAETDNSLFANICELADSDDKWLQRAGKTFKSGSPITIRLVMEQLRRAKALSLLDCFKMELNMACECTAVGEFQEGVRALLIDKDGKPAWQFATPEQVPDEVIAGFFKEHWPEGHPLANLKEL